MSAGWEPPPCKGSCFSCEPKNLNHGRRAKALPITIAKTPYQCKTGAGAKRHQYNNRAGTSTKHRQHEQRQKAVALANDARARVFLPAQRRTEVMGNAPAHPNFARRVRIWQRRKKQPAHRGTAPEEDPPRTHDEHAQPGRTHRKSLITRVPFPSASDASLPAWPSLN